MCSTNSIVPVWEEMYSEGSHQNKYPWDSVVSFVFNNKPNGTPCDEIKILEVGFGAGGNLWFAAREGFEVSGIEGSESAVKFAVNRFKKDALEGDLRVGDFTKLPFGDNSFHMVIDRAALVCVGREAQQRSVNEIHRVLKPCGKFLHQTYATSHTSCDIETLNDDGLSTDITTGSLIGVGQLCFSSKDDIINLFSDGWKIEEAQLREWKEKVHPLEDVHAEWLIVAKKTKR